ncbi:MAG TPA: RNA polymerase sigma factor [Blastocatellia bacterium]|nr:RNA polymerase sigma factor [Blastocatellia bacterium]
MPYEVAQIALMTDNLGLCDSPSNSVAPSLTLLIERAKAGEPAAFEQLVDHHQRKVLSTAWRMLGNREDARDAAQEVFLRVHKYLKSFRTDQEFAAWLYRIVVNVCRDHARKHGYRHQFASFESERDAGAFEELVSNEDVETNAIRSQERALVAQALATLSNKERAALVLRDLEGLSTKEVAQALGSTQTTVRTQISSARAKIKLYRDRALNRARRG